MVNSDRPRANSVPALPANDAWTKKWATYAKTKNIAGHKEKPLTNDPMEATYIGMHMWAQAVEKAKSTDPDKVIAAMAGQTFQAPGGFVSTMDQKNHHLHKPVFIGEVQANGQFQIVWKTPGPIRAEAWSPFIPDSAKKVADWTYPWACGNCETAKYVN